MKRRNFLGQMAITPLILSPHSLQFKKVTERQSSRVRYSVNAYSFNSLLRNGEMTFTDMLEFAADAGLDAVDLTGYYFSTYPERPGKEELFKLKRKALDLGLDIPWTGIRNNFVTPDEELRKSDREMIRQWLEASSQLGASLMRVFAGKGDHEGESREEVKERMVEDFKTCTKYAEENGVILALQHHNDFLHTADEIIDILERVNSEWFGLILDVGSLHADDPYAEIQKLSPYANYWFVKEHVYPGGKKTEVDMARITEIIKNEGYRGYVSFESLSEGDPKKIIKTMVGSFRQEM